MMMAKDGEVALLFQPLLGLAANFSGVSREPSGRSDDRGRNFKGHFCAATSWACPDPSRPGVWRRAALPGLDIQRGTGV